MASPKNADELAPILQELNRQTDRGMAIIATALIDEMLTEALESRLILSNTLRDKLFSFERNGPLSALSAKIDMAYAIGVIKQEHRDDLHLMRRVRNRFAHHLQPIDFTDSEVVSFCDTFATCRPMADWKELSRRQQFSATFTVLVSLLRLLCSMTNRLSLDECHGAIDRVLKVLLVSMSSDKPLTPEILRAAHKGLEPEAT